jgi:hypothetical protein
MASTLLALALSLLIAAQQPYVPESLKIQAISMAQYAISVSLAELGEATKVQADLVDIAPNLPKELVDIPKPPPVTESCEGTPYGEGGYCYVSSGIDAQPMQ